jgi:hypothetical protein
MQEERLAVRSKLLLTYNISLQHQEEYLQFMVKVFVPTLQKIGLENAGVWHTLYGNYPIRLLAFVAEEKDMKEAMAGDSWKQIEARLKGYVTDYLCRVVPFEPGFQF